MKRFLTIMLSVLLVINLAVPFAFADDKSTREIVKWSFNEKPSKAAASASADEKSSLTFSDGIWTCWNGDSNGTTFSGDGKALVSERDKNDTYSNIIISPPVSLPTGSAKISFNATGEDEYFALKVVEVGEKKDNTTVLYDITSEGFIPSYIYNAKEIANTVAGRADGGNTFRVEIPSEFLGKRVCFAFSHLPYGYNESGSLSIDNVAVNGADEVLTKTVTFSVPGEAKCKEKSMETDTDGKLRYLPEPTLEGYTFVGWELNGETVTADHIYESDVTLTSKWEKKRGKTYKIAIESATIAVATDAIGERITAAEPGETVYLHTEGSSSNGVYFHGWEVVKGNTELVDARSANPHFTMPEEDVTVKAVYNREKPSVNVTFDAGIGTVEGQKSVTLQTDKNGRLPYIPGAISDGDLIFAGWTRRYLDPNDTNLEADDLTTDTVIDEAYLSDVTYIAVWKESTDDLDAYAYWKNPGKYGFVFSKKFGFSKGRRYFIYLVKDSKKVPESLSDTHALKLIEVTSVADDYDFTDEIIMHGDGTYYAGVLAVNHKDGKSFYQLRGEESVAFTYREADYLNFESQSVSDGSLVDLREGEVYNLNYSAVSLPAPLSDRGWSMKPFIAVRKTGENSSLSEWDYTAFDNTGKESGNSWTRKISIKERGNYEIKYGVTLVKNGGRITYMTKNDTGLLSSSFDVSVLGKNDKIDRILTGLRIGNYTFDASELAALTDRTSSDGSWSVKFIKGTSQDTVNITLNGYIGGPVIIEREDQSNRLAVNITANGACVVTAGSELIDGQYIGALTAVDRSSAVTLNLRVNGTLSLYGKNGILAGCTKEKDFNSSQGDTNVKINGKGSVNIYAESAGIIAKSPRLFSGSTYRGGILSVDERADLNILLRERNSRATGIDIGNVPGFSVYVKGSASLAVSSVNGTGINKDAAMQYAVLSKDPVHETYGNLKGSWYLAVPEGKLESGIDLYSPNSYSVVSSIGTEQKFNFDIDNSYVRENPCLMYRLTLLTSDTSSNAGFALVDSADDRELKCSYALKKAGPQIFDMRVSVYPVYASSLIKEVHEAITIDVNGEHNHNWILVSNSATCVSAGEMKWTCSICGEGKGEAVSALGHLYPKEWYDNGKEHYKVCIRCNETVDKGEHKWVKGAATHMSCTENVYPYTCSVCGAKKQETEKQNGQHKFSAYQGNESGHWRVCTICGYKETGSHKFETTSWGDVICSVCKWYGKTGPEDIYCNVNVICPHITAEIDISRLSAAHRDRIKNGDYESMRWYNNGNSATIKSDTLKYKTSTGDMSKYNKYDGLLGFMIIFSEDDYDLFDIGFEWVNLKKLTHVNGYPATCDAEGVKEHYICACGKAIDKNFNVIDVKIPKLKHSYDDVCDATCNLCGAIRVAEHDFETVWTVKDQAHFHKCSKCGVQKDYELCIASGWTMEKEAGCTEAGHAYQSCMVCGTRLAEKDIPNAHEFTDWVYLNGADCTVAGEMKRECLKCGAEETMAVGILGHVITYHEGSEATCISGDTEAYYSCDRCRKLFSDSEGKNEISKVPETGEKNMANHVGGFMEFDDNSHWILCACGAHLYRAAHTLDSMGACTVCDYVKGGASHNTPYGSSGFPLWIIILIAVILIIIILLILLLKKKDRKEKEATDEKKKTSDSKKKK